MFSMNRNIEKQCVLFSPVRCTSWFPKAVEIYCWPNNFEGSVYTRLPSEIDFYIHDLHFVFFVTPVGKSANCPTRMFWHLLIISDNMSSGKKDICKQEGEECGKILFLVLYWEVHNVFRERWSYCNFILSQSFFSPFPQFRQNGIGHTKENRIDS